MKHTILLKINRKASIRRAYAEAMKRDEAIKAKMYQNIRELEAMAAGVIHLQGYPQKG